MGADVKRMAELLKSGAIMLKETCPQCGSVLFQIGKEIQCVKCNRQVVIVQTTEEEAKFLGGQILESVERTLLEKIQEINIAMKNEREPERLLQLSNVLSGWLSALEKVKKIKEPAG